MTDNLDIPPFLRRPVPGEHKNVHKPGDPKPVLGDAPVVEPDPVEVLEDEGGILPVKKG